ncbi:hypothetical protein [Streptomyces luteireticuli]|uniref:Uncharacterized protein n=1 Tax=Streptomyces luteireticuli TaxID=173858 RepID=A0ABN0YQQ6_9ACTN
MRILLVAAYPGDLVPGHELADPECLVVPGLTERPEVEEWMAAVGYGPDDDPDLLVYLVVEDDEGTVPAGFEKLLVEV